MPDMWNFNDGCPFWKHVFAVEMLKTEIKMSKPLFLEQAILDLSKTLMYEFQYDCINKLQPYLIYLL